MNAKRYCLFCAILACLVGLPAHASTHKTRGTHKAKIDNPGRIANATNVPNGKKISLGPLPVDIYLRSKEKPTIAFTTPCIVIEKATHGFPPILAFETFMFQTIGNVNDANFLPARLEPVCV
jgi:hypothetical protein